MSGKDIKKMSDNLDEESHFLPTPSPEADAAQVLVNQEVDPLQNNPQVHGIEEDNIPRPVVRRAVRDPGDFESGSPGVNRAPTAAVTTIFKMTRWQKSGGGMTRPVCASGKTRGPKIFKKKSGAKAKTKVTGNDRPRQGNEQTDVIDNTTAGASTSATEIITEAIVEAIASPRAITITEAIAIDTDMAIGDIEIIPFVTTDDIIKAAEDADAGNDAAVDAGNDAAADAGNDATANAGNDAAAAAANVAAADASTGPDADSNGGDKLNAGADAKPGI